MQYARGDIAEITFPSRKLICDATAQRIKAELDLDEKKREESTAAFLAKQVITVISDSEDDDIAKKANLNDVLARLIPEIALLSGCKHDLLEAMEAINSNPKHREALNEFLIKLYG